VLTIADQRVPGTTFRKPAELFAHEQLRSHGGRRSYRLEAPVLRTVARDCLVTDGASRYSVSAVYVGKVVQVQGGAGEPLHIFYRRSSLRPMYPWLARTRRR
jgi:hypothetical protein